MARALWTGIFGLVLAMRLMVTAGLMPTWEQGRLSIVPCSEVTAQAGHHATNGKANRDHGKHEGKVHQPCPYAVAAASLTVEPLHLKDAPSLVAGEAAAFQPANVVEVGRGLAAPPPPATGPPALA